MALLIKQTKKNTVLYSKCDMNNCLLTFRICIYFLCERYLQALDFSILFSSIRINQSTAVYSVTGTHSSDKDPFAGSVKVSYAKLCFF